MSAVEADHNQTAVHGLLNKEKGYEVVDVEKKNKLLQMKCLRGFFKKIWVTHQITQDVVGYVSGRITKSSRSTVRKYYRSFRDR